MGELLSASTVSEAITAALRKKVECSSPLCLVSFVVGDDASTKVYVTSQQKIAANLGIEYKLISLAAEVSFSQIAEEVTRCNHDASVTGIIINKPFPEAWSESETFSLIASEKDVEGMNPWNLGKIFSGEPAFVSPTVSSILEFLKMLQVDLYGKEVTIVGFSTLIGQPLAILLGKQFATVTITHIATFESGRLPGYVGSADILIAAVGKPQVIKGEWVKPGAIVIDVGTSVQKGRVVGDVEFEAAQKRAAFITPVPGGVGKLTPLFLFQNVLRAAGY